MTIESVTYISDFNTSNPAAGDLKSEGDDHIRNIKIGVKGTFPNLVGAASPGSMGTSLGLVGTPAYSFTGDADTGIWSPAANTLAASAGGSEVVRWTATVMTVPATTLTWSGNPTHSGNHTFGGTVTLPGGEAGYRRLPAASITTGTFVAADSGKAIYATAGVTAPNATMASEDVVTIVNTTAGNITITQGASLTMRLAGTASTGNRTLAQFGVATIVYLNATACFISGAGLS